MEANCEIPGCIHAPGCVISCGYDEPMGLASVGAGWGPLVREAFAARPAEVRIIQVKEKFAALRIYAEPHIPAFAQVLAELGARSLVTCEECGEPGALDERYSHVLTLCAPCQVVRDERRAQRSAEAATFLAALLAERESKH